jgi:hypothetical protein
VQSPAAPAAALGLQTAPVTARQAMAGQALGSLSQPVFFHRSEMILSWVSSSTKVEHPLRQPSERETLMPQAPGSAVEHALAFGISLE